ncbi:double-strand-break repair protein rad21 homolog isoform X2 [Uloborus diversus]|uniref:double-strand-break repair protein rad21 homolog isoform X2 n=1 Tax=Uloborus diversus TaxID=327109 RepID=UPI00240A8476|nr:double-strand-break repair protein rad21 homolog isoform X2 [Uloborus diversus]
MVICFTKYLLEKKGSLSRIWLAAHWENKLKRSCIFEIDIQKSISDMITAEIILDLRISGHLLIGIVKIYSKKAQFLLNECNNVFYIVSAFRSCKIDLPDKKKQACVKEITLPENFEDLNISDNSDLITMLSVNQSCVEEITLKETFEPLANINDEIEGFEFEGDTGLDLIEDLHSLSKYNKRKVSTSIPSDKVKDSSPEKGTSVNYFEVQNDENELLENNEDIILQNEDDSSLQNDEHHLLADNSLRDCNSSDLITCKNQLKKPDIIKDPLSLEPLKSACEKKLKPKRKLIIDPVTYITYEKIQKQIFEASDLAVVNFMPGTKRLMHLKQIGTAEQLFRLPTINMGNEILHLYQRNLRSYKSSESMESSEEEEKQEETFRKCVKQKSGSKCSVLCESIQLDDDMESELDVNGYNISTSLEVTTEVIL